VTRPFLLARAAHHEAGHALAYVTFGWPMRSVEIDDQGGGLTRGRERTAALYTRAVICLCGPCAEARFLCSGIDEVLRDGGRTDAARARALLRDNARFAQALAAAQALVADHRTDLDSFADALIRHRRLTFNRADG
jgi:hypothetical protein